MQALEVKVLMKSPKNWALFLCIALSILLVQFVRHAGPDFKGVFDFTKSSKAISSTTVTAKLDPNKAIGFQINNKSNYGFADLVVSCSFIGKSGSVIKDGTFTLFSHFDPSSVKNVTLSTVDIPEQTHSISCEADDVQVKTEVKCYIDPKPDSNNKARCVEESI